MKLSPRCKKRGMVRRMEKSMRTVSSAWFLPKQVAVAEKANTRYLVSVSARNERLVSRKGKKMGAEGGVGGM